MSSPSFSDLAKLDDSIRGLQGYLDCLRAGLEVPENQVKQSFIEVCQYAARIRELILAKRPGVAWTDRPSLDSVIQDLAAAEAARSKERRVQKLLELADELDSGTITHRLKSRITALDELRQNAVRELLAEAAEEQPKDLPGPEAAAWMAWACGSQEGANAALFSELARGFPATMRFANDMEDTYWRPRERGTEAIVESAEGGVAFAREAIAELPSTRYPEAGPSFASVYSDRLPALGSRSEIVTQATTSSTAAAISLEQAPIEARLSAVLNLRPEATSHSKSSAEVGTNEGSNGNLLVEPLLPTRSGYQEAASLGMGGNGVATRAQAHLGLSEAETEPVNSTGIFGDKEHYYSHPAVEADPSRLQATVERHYAESNNASALADVPGGFLASLNRSRFVVIGITISILLLVVVSAVVAGKRSSKPQGATSELLKAPSAATAVAPVTDLELAEEIEKKLKVIKDSSIYVTVEHGTATLQGRTSSEADSVMAENLALELSQIKVVRDRLQVEAAGASRSASHAKP